MTKIKLGIDIDGTVTRPDAIVKILHKYFDATLKFENMTEYDMSASFGVDRQWFKQYEEEFYSTSQVAAFAGEVLNRLAQHYELIYITAREQTLYDLTEKWFKDHHIPYDQLILLGGHDKVAAVKEHQIALFIDDRYENCVDIATQCQIPVLLVDTPYNQKPLVDNMIRISNWLEIDQFIQQQFK